jgi:hypothetical protein
MTVETDRRRRRTAGDAVHLRVGATTAFPGPACGQDLRVRARGQGVKRGTRLTDNVASVTCLVCLSTVVTKPLDDE